MSKEVGTAISVRDVVKERERLIASYKQKVARLPKLLRESMWYAYASATDDMLKAMDKAKVD